MKNAVRCNRAPGRSDEIRCSVDGIYQVDWPLARDASCLPSLILWRALSRELIFRNAALRRWDDISLNFERRWLAIFQTLVTPGDAHADGYMSRRHRNYAPFSSVFSPRLTEIFSVIDRFQWILFSPKHLFTCFFFWDYSIYFPTKSACYVNNTDFPNEKRKLFNMTRL